MIPPEDDVSGAGAAPKALRRSTVSARAEVVSDSLSEKPGIPANEVLCAEGC
jgi:hypothetical protein